VKKPEWKCAAPHCRGKSGLEKGMRRTWRCGQCKKLYHVGCSGGAPEVECDECWVAAARKLFRLQ
jgi:hypothetical protein